MKGVIKLKKIISIEGMTCNHCVNHVEKALGGIVGVKSVKVNLSKNNALINSKEEINDDIVKQTVNEIGYKVLNIENKKGLF